MIGKLMLAAVATLVLVATDASASTLTFKVRSYHNNQVDVAFFSQNRNHAWPGGTKVWVIKDYEVHNYKLDCANGEKICYGAWLRGDTTTYWGTGYGGKQRCTSCCFVCNGGTTPVMNLNSR